jgi:hypothetical protein
MLVPKHLSFPEYDDLQKTGKVEKSQKKVKAFKERGVVIKT